MKNTVKFVHVAGALTLAALATVPAASWAESATEVLSGITENAELAARVPAKIREAGVLVIGSDNAYAPWEYLAGDDGQTAEGIDVDLAKALGATLGLEIDFQTSAFEAIIPSLGTKFDLGWSALSITEERMQTVNFVTYAESGSQWAVQTGNPTDFDPANLCGTKLAIQSGSWFETQIAEADKECTDAGNATIEVLPFKVQTEAITRVAVGGADATVAGDATIGYAAVQSRGALETLDAVGVVGGSGQVGIAVVKTDADLTQLIVDTMNELIQNGTYGEVYAHWGADILTIETSEIKSAESN